MNTFATSGCIQMKTFRASERWCDVSWMYFVVDTPAVSTGMEVNVSASIPLTYVPPIWVERRQLPAAGLQWSQEKSTCLIRVYDRRLSGRGEEIGIKRCSRLCAGCKQTPRKTFFFLCSVAKLAANVFSREASVPKKRTRRRRYLLLRGTHYASNPDVHPNRHSLLPMRAKAS